MSIKPIKTAIIGYGFSAKTFHLPFITNLAEFELSAICSSQGAAVKHDWPGVSHFTAPAELLAQSDAELVIITAPNDVHFSLTQAALQCHKHVIIEKPFVTSVADGEALIALAERQQKILSVYHNRRWDSDFLTVKKLINSGRLGQLKSYESHFDRFRPQVRQRWRETASDGGGILYDLGPHLIDQAIHLFGLPEGLTAQCLVMREGSNNVDYFDIVLHYPDKQVRLHADLFSAGPNPRFSLKGSGGSFSKWGLDPQEARLIGGILPTAENWADEQPEDYGILYQADAEQSVRSERGGYQTYFKAMARAIRKNKPVPVSAIDALESIRLIELAMESSRLGQTLPLQRFGLSG